MKSMAKILGTLALSLAVTLTLTLTLTGTVWAADAKAAAAGGEENTTYKAKTVYDFEDDMVEGDLQRPDGELINGLKKTEHSSLIEIRKDFIPEMLKSLEDI